MEQKELAKKVIALHQDLKRAVAEIEAIKNKAEAILHYMGGNSSTTKDISRAVKLLEVISKHQKDGLTKPQFYGEARKVGYPDQRGLAGFFKGRASLTYLPINGEDRVFLTKAGLAWLENTRRENGNA